MSVQVVFAAVLLSSCYGLKGHLEPLGNHRPPDVPIDEYSEPLHPERFYQEYVLPFRPVVFRGAARHSPAFKLWTDDYLAREYGDLELRLEEKVEGGSNDALPAGALGIGRDVMKNFLSHYRTSNGYIVSELPTAMYKDVAVLPCMACGALQHKIQEVNLWLSAKGAYSKIHRDAFNAINCLLNGTKDWFFMDKKYDKEVYVVHRSKWEMGGLSLVEPRRVDLERFPKFADVHYSFVTIRAGDCVYVPGGYYHQVDSYGDRNLAISVLFSQQVRGFHSNGCDGANLRYRLLNESNVFWAYNGTGIMSMGNMDIEFFRNLIDNYTLLHGDDLTQDSVFEALLDLNAPFSEQTKKADVGEEMKNEMRTIAGKVLQTLRDASPKKGRLTVDDLSRIDLETWKTVTKIIEPIDISNTYNNEYSVVDGERLKDEMQRFFETNVKMSKESFVELYTKKVHGSEYIGKKTFGLLDSDKDGRISRKQFKAELADALDDLFSQADGMEHVDEDDEENIRQWSHGEDDADHAAHRDSEDYEHASLLDTLEEEEGDSIGDHDEL